MTLAAKIGDVLELSTAKPLAMVALVFTLMGFMILVCVISLITVVKY